MRGPVVWLMLATTGVSATPSYADGDAVAGKTVFENQCASCHSTEPGKHGFGPSLAGVVGRMSGTLPAFTYTPAMVNAHLTWDAATLDAFLTSSTQKVQGTAMAVALPSETTRADVIAFLATLGQAAVVSAPASTPSVAQAPVGHGPSQDELLHAASDTRNWLYASKDYAGQRFIDLNQINAGNAGRLRAVCIYRANSAGPTQTNQLVYNGVMYSTVDQSDCCDRRRDLPRALDL